MSNDDGDTSFNDRTFLYCSRAFENVAKRNDEDLSLTGDHAHPGVFIMLDRIGERDLVKKLLKNTAALYCYD
jgi:hypothetical protein